MSFAFGFQIAEVTTGADDANTQASAVVTPENDVVVARPEGAEGGDPNPRTSHRRPFTWVSPGDLSELWRRRRQRDIYCKTAIERSLSRDLDGDEELLGGSSDPVGNRTIHLRHVVVREWDDNDDNGANNSPEKASNVEDSSCSESDDGHLYGSEGSVIRNGVYEGGAAVWECSLDLVKYVMEMSGAVSPDMTSSSSSSDPTDASPGRYVLELGCGHALPSCVLLQEELLAAARHKALDSIDDGDAERTSSRSGTVSTFVMVDYNRSVVESITLPNVILNTMETLPTDETIPDGADASTLEDSVNTGSIEEMLSHRIVLGSGDWLDMSEQLLHASNPRSHLSTTDYAEHLALPQDGYFDVILAAETLYTPQAALETAQLVMRHLHPHHPSAAAWVASKRYYFGVGGGVDDFRAAIDPSRFHVETVRVIDTGVGNIREILKVTHKSIVS